MLTCIRRPSYRLLKRFTRCRSSSQHARLSHGIAQESFTVENKGISDFRCEFTMQLRPIISSINDPKTHKFGTEWGSSQLL